MDHIQHEHKTKIDPADVGKYQNHSHVGGVTLGWARRTTRLLADRVVLQFPDLPKETASGLHLPDERFFQRTTRDATVVAVGPGVWREGRMRRGKWVPAVFLPTTLRVGDRVVIDAMKTQTGLLTEWDGQRGDFRIVREEDVDLVVESDVGVGVE